jgi:hypothetical protein
VKKGIRTILLVGGLALLVCGCTASPPAGAQKGAVVEAGVTRARTSGARLEQHGFAVLDFRSIRDEYRRVAVIGEIRNTGIAARGVELQATLRDSDGRVLAVGHFCPASDRNIAPGEAWPFGYSFGLQPDAAKAELRIVGAFRAMDISSVAAMTP